MRKKGVNILLFLGVVIGVMTVTLFTPSMVAQGQQCDPNVDPACQPPPVQPTCGIPGTPPCPVQTKKKPTKVPTFIPQNTPKPTVTHTPTPTSTEIATLRPACGLPGLPSCAGGAFLSLVCPANNIYSASSSSGANVFFADPIVNSTCQGAPPKVVCVPPSGALFPVGNNLVICTVTDSCGLAATCSFFVKVNPYRPLPTSTATPTPVVVVPGSPAGSGAAWQNVIPPVSLLSAVQNGILGVLIIAIIIIGGLGFWRFFGKRDLPSSPSDQFVKFEVPADNNGFGTNGFNNNGFNANGFNNNGFNANGFNNNGFNANGFDANGFNANGFNSNGFDANGFDANGFNANGFNNNGFNANGFNSNGFDANGFDANGFDANGFDANGLDSNGFKGGEWISHQ